MRTARRVEIDQINHCLLRCENFCQDIFLDLSSDDHHFRIVHNFGHVGRKQRADVWDYNCRYYETLLSLA